MIVFSLASYAKKKIRIRLALLTQEILQVCKSSYDTLFRYIYIYKVIIRTRIYKHCYCNISNLHESVHIEFNGVVFLSCF